MHRLLVLLWAIAALVNTALGGPLQPKSELTEVIAQAVLSVPLPIIHYEYPEEEREKMIVFYATLDQAKLLTILSGKYEELANSENPEEEKQLEADAAFLECIVKCAGNQECVRNDCLPSRIYFG